MSVDRRGSLSAKWLRAIATVAIFAACLATAYTRTWVEYKREVWGDAAYYVDLAQSLYDGSPRQTTPTTIHGRRVLGSVLVAAAMRAHDAVRRPSAYEGAFTVRFDPTEYRHTAPAGRRYERALATWHALDAVSYFAIGLLLLAIMNRYTPGASAPGLFSVVCVFAATPVLGRLYLSWPFLNDLIGLACGLGGLYLAATRRTVFSAALLGAALLARENLVLVYPVFVWVLRDEGEPWHRVALHAALTTAPYAILTQFPLSAAARPFVDLTSNAAGAHVGAGADYVALLRFHLDRMAHGSSWWLRKLAMHWVVAGPFTLLVMAEYPWRDRAALRRDALLWLTFAAIVVASFRVDRYAVYGLFALLPLARFALAPRRPGWVWAALVALFLWSVNFASYIMRGGMLQIETASSTDVVRAVQACVVTTLLLVGLRRITRDSQPAAGLPR